MTIRYVRDYPVRSDNITGWGARYSGDTASSPSGCVGPDPSARTSWSRQFRSASANQSDLQRPVFHGIIGEMRRAAVATIAKVLILVSLPIVLARGGWVLGTTWHLVMVPCRHLTGGPIIIGGTCFARPFWTRPEVLEAIGAVAGLIVVAIMLLALESVPCEFGGPPSAFPIGSSVRLIGVGPERSG